MDCLLEEKQNTGENTEIVADTMETSIKEGNGDSKDALKDTERIESKLKQSEIPVLIQDADDKDVLKATDSVQSTLDTSVGKKNAEHNDVLKASESMKATYEPPALGVFGVSVKSYKDGKGDGNKNLNTTSKERKKSAKKTAHVQDKGTIANTKDHLAKSSGDTQTDSKKDNETGDKENELRDSRINFKLTEVVQAYQEALDRKLKALNNKQETQCNQSEDSDSSDRGVFLWKKAKASFINKAAKVKVKIEEPDNAHQDEDTAHRSKLHKWRRLPASQRRSSGYAARRKSITELQNSLRRKLVLMKFRRIARLIIFCRRCVLDHCFKFRERSELTPYMQTLNYMDYTAEQITDLMFDRSKFRADRQMRISEETKKILSKGKSIRTQQEIYTAQIALRNNRSFAEFPARMQRMIAECGHYEAYEAKRVITREGHPPAAFYFVLSGAVVAMQLDQGRNIASAVAEFIKGDTFEEKPMLNSSPRQCTVLTKEPCEFLSISEKDYKTIFMQGGVKTLNDPDQELFLKSLSCLAGWPIKILPNFPTKTLFHYYKRGAVLAMDTQQSDWLIIVKSGSLSILKKLKRVGPYEWRKKVIKPLTEKEKRERQEQRTQWRRFILPELRLPTRKSKEVDEIEELVDGRPKPFEDYSSVLCKHLPATILQQQTQIKHPEIKVQFEDGGPQKKGKKYCYPSLWTYKKGLEDEEEREQQHTFSNINKQYLYLMSSSGNKDQSRSARHDPRHQVQRSKSKESIEQPTAEERPMTSPALSRGTTTSSLSISSEPHTSSSLSSLIGSSDFDERIRNIMEDVYADMPKTTESYSEVDLKPQFVKVQTLIKGQIWGLADLILEDQASFTVVSNGADCVLINKQFYLDHAPEKLLRKMRQELCPYPSDDELQNGLQISVDWNDYRQNELTATMSVVKGKRIMRDIALGSSMVQDTC